MIFRGVDHGMPADIVQVSEQSWADLDDALAYVRTFMPPEGMLVAIVKIAGPFSEGQRPNTLAEVN